MLLVGGFAVGADALVTSDEERLAELADELTATSDRPRVDTVLAWTDPARAPVEIRARGRVDRYEDDDAALAEDLGDALAPLAVRELDVVQRSVRVRGDRGTVAVRTRSGEGLHDATFHLVRSGQGWLIERVQLL